MSIVHAATPAQSSSGTTLTISNFPISAGTKRRLIIGVDVYFRGCTGVDVGGVAATKLSDAANAAGGPRCTLWEVLDANLPSAGNHDIVASFDGTISLGGILHAVLLDEMGQGAAEDVAGQVYGSTASISDSVTPDSDAAVLVALLDVQDPRTITETGGQGSAVSTLDSPYRTRLYIWEGPTPAALTASSFTLSGASSVNAHLVAAFTPDAAPSVTPPTAGLSASVVGNRVTVTDESVAGTNPITSVEYDYYDGEDGLEGDWTSSATHEYDPDTERGDHTIRQRVNDGVTAQQEATEAITTESRYIYDSVTVGGRSVSSNIVDIPDA